MYVCMYVCMYDVCVFVCVCVYIYIYIYILHYPTAETEQCDFTATMCGAWSDLYLEQPGGSNCMGERCYNKVS